jgi:hypothetical protein
MADRTPPDLTATKPAARPSWGRVPQLGRAIGALMLLEAASLAVASSLHLAGVVHGQAPFDPDHAGIAEALIGVVLALGGVAMLRAPRRAWRAGLAATGVAIAGFVVGLSFTLQGGHAPDIAYHLALLPVFLATFAVLLRHRTRRAPAVTGERGDDGPAEPG